MPFLALHPDRRVRSRRPRRAHRRRRAARPRSAARGQHLRVLRRRVAVPVPPAGARPTTSRRCRSPAGRCSASTCRRNGPTTTCASPCSWWHSSSSAGSADRASAAPPSRCATTPTARRRTRSASASSKLRAFAIAGFIAGFGGALLAGAVEAVPFTERYFLVADSLALVALVVIGGIASPMGAVLGSLWIVGLPAFFPDNTLVPLLTSSLGLLILLALLPRWADADRVLGARRPLRVGGIETRSAADRTHDGDAAGARPLGPAADRRGRPRARRRRASRFVSVVSSRSTTPRLRVGDDEIVGLIGTNGAGKSTLMNAIGGFVPCAGTVRIHGDDVSSTGAARRAPPGSRAHVPGRAALPRAHRARDGRGRAGGAWAHRPPLHRAVPAPFVRPRAAAARRGRRSHRLPRSRSLRQQPHRRPLHRDPPHRRAGRAARPRRARALPRRADRRRRAARDRGVRSADQGDPARARRGDAGDRARHAAHHEHQRPCLLPRDRPRHRRGRSR